METTKLELHQSTITNKVMYVVKLSGLVKYFEKESSAMRFLNKMGFTYLHDDVKNTKEIVFGKTKKSVNEIWLEQKFKKV
jgi:hypothetical protein